MAQKLVYIDDITGEEGARTFSFQIEGVGLEIDLSEDSIKAFYEAIAPFVGPARRSTRNSRIPDQLRVLLGPASTIPAPAEDPDNGKHTAQEVADCKSWLERIGVTPSHARIPVDCWKAYRANDPSLLKPERLKRED